MFQDFITRFIHNQFYIAMCHIPDLSIPNEKMINSNLSVKKFPFFNLQLHEKLSYFEEKGGRLVFTFSQIWTYNSYNFLNLQLILNCNIPKFKLKHRQFRKKEKKKVKSNLSVN